MKMESYEVLTWSLGFLSISRSGSNEADRRPYNLDTPAITTLRTVPFSPFLSSHLIFRGFKEAFPEIRTLSSHKPE